jgi:translation initiation factor IF-3
VDDTGQQMGIITRDAALTAARTAGLDLVEVAPLERPPVCRIMDYGKFKYEQKRKTSKQKTHRIHTKEIRVHPKTGEHDIMVKVSHAREFLSHKDKVLVKVEFRGREIAHIEQGRAVMDTILKALEDAAKIEKPPGMEGKRLTALLAPKP